MKQLLRDKHLTFALLMMLIAAVLCVVAQPSDSTATAQQAANAATVPDSETVTTWVPADVLNIVDGDTLDVDVLLPWDVTLRGQRVRCTGYDAWEASRRGRGGMVTDEELVKGKRASEQFEALLESGAVYLVPSQVRARDPFGRLRARLKVVTPEGRVIDVAEWMEQRGHVRVPNEEVEAKYGD
jgi:endonuclease YncB( thermonuclease family)